MPFCSKCINGTLQRVSNFVKRENKTNITSVSKVEMEGGWAHSHFRRTRWRTNMVVNVILSTCLEVNGSYRRCAAVLNGTLAKATRQQRGTIMSTENLTVEMPSSWDQTAFTALLLYSLSLCPVYLRVFPTFLNRSKVFTSQMWVEMVILTPCFSPKYPLEHLSLLVHISSRQYTKFVYMLLELAILARANVNTAPISKAMVDILA